MSSYEGEITLDAATWYEFLNQFVPNKAHEYMFGPPVLKDDLLIVKFAADSETHPSSWAKVPDLGGGK